MRASVGVKGEVKMGVKGVKGEVKMGVRVVRDVAALSSTSRSSTSGRMESRARSSPSSNGGVVAS